jgi:hypothetical protein
MPTKEGDCSYLTAPLIEDGTMNRNLDMRDIVTSSSTLCEAGHIGTRITLPSRS